MLERLGVDYPYQASELCDGNGHCLVYEVFGADPRAGFVSGIHTNRVYGKRGEYPLILPLYRSLNQGGESLPAHLRILNADPRVRQREPENLNRCFNEPIGDAQAQLLARVLSQFPDLQFLFSFHEDVDENGPLNFEPEESTPIAFYMYDIPLDENGDGATNGMVSAQVEELREALKGKHFSLYTGWDDVDKPDRKAQWIENGYCLVPADPSFDCSLEEWFVRQGRESGVQRRAFTFEVPGVNCSMAQKQQMLEIILDQFVRPFLALK